MSPARRRACSLLSFAVLGCVVPIKTEVWPSAREQTLTRVAVMPLEARPSVGSGGVSEGVTSDASQLVTARVVEALSVGSPLEIVPPSEVELWLNARPGPPLTDASEIGALMRKTFEIDAVLSGTVSRFLERHGSAGGATRPAAVSFQIELWSPDGNLLWRGTYSEAQQSLSSDLGSFRRVAERRFRWVTAESLAAYGARELVRGMGQETEQWK